MREAIRMQDSTSGVKGVIIRRNRFLILVKPGGELDLPGGRIESGENPIATLKREISEETGLKARIHSPIAYWSFHNRSGLFIKGVTFICRYVGRDRVRLSREHKDYAWLRLEELTRLEFMPNYGLDTTTTKEIGWMAGELACSRDCPGLN